MPHPWSTEPDPVAKTWACCAEVTVGHSNGHPGLRACGLSWVRQIRKGFVLIRNDFFFTELLKSMSRTPEGPSPGKTSSSGFWRKYYRLWSWPAPQGGQRYGEGTQFHSESNATLWVRREGSSLSHPPYYLVNMEPKRLKSLEECSTVLPSGCWKSEVRAC